MSSNSVALKAMPEAAEVTVGDTPAVLSGVKAKLLVFLNKLPDYFDDVDPATQRRLPMPY